MLSEIRFQLILNLSSKHKIILANIMMVFSKILCNHIIKQSTFFYNNTYFVYFTKFVKEMCSIVTKLNCYFHYHVAT